MASHEKFADKYDLKFNLIADTEKEILNAYGVWGEKSMYGKKYMGVLRSTYVIDERGVVDEVFEKVKTKDHTNQIITVLRYRLNMAKEEQNNVNKEKLKALQLTMDKNRKKLRQGSYHEDGRQSR